MRKDIHKLILIFILLVIAKSLLSSFILAPSEFSDGYIYSKIARSVFFSQELSVHEINVDHLPLYPIILSPAYIFQDMNNVYLFMKIMKILIIVILLL